MYSPHSPEAARVLRLMEALERTGQWSRQNRTDTLLPSSPPARPSPAPRRAKRPIATSSSEAKASSPASQRLLAQLQIVVAYCNGATQEEIAATLGIHVQTVRARLREAGVQTQESRAALSSEDKNVIRALHGRGQSARQLARRYGVAHTTILRVLERSS